MGILQDLSTTGRAPLPGDGGRLVVDARGLGLGHAGRGIGRVIVELTQAMSRIGVDADVIGPASLAQHIGGALRFFQVPVRGAWGILSPGRISPQARVLRLAPTAPGPLDQQSVVVCYDLIPFHNPHVHFPMHRRVRSPLAWSAYLRSLDTLRRAQRIWAISRTVCRDVQESLRIRQDRVKAIPLAPPTWARPPSAERVADVKRRHSLPDRFVLWVPGGWNANKNVRGMFRAAAAAPEFRLVVVGSPPPRLRWWLDIEARRAGVTPSWLGRVSDEELAALMAGASCVAVPSTHEGFGMPVAEAIACGGVVVANDIEVLRELAVAGVCYGDATKPRFFADVLRQAASSAARQDAVSVRSWDDVALDVVVLADGIVHDPSGAGRPSATS